MAVVGVGGDLDDFLMGFLPPALVDRLATKTLGLIAACLEHRIVVTRNNFNDILNCEQFIVLIVCGFGFSSSFLLFVPKGHIPSYIKIILFYKNTVFPIVKTYETTEKFLS
jgi:hypothetical protein